MSKLSRGEKGERLVNSLLSSLNKEARLLSDVTYIFGKNDMSHQIDQIYIHPFGVFVFETKNYFGDISVDKNNNWTKNVRGKTERLANPIKQNKSHILVVSTLLKKRVDVVGAVIFIRNNAPYLGDENLINFNDVELFINSYPYKKILTKKEIDEIYDTLKSSSVTLDKNYHIESIKYLKAVNKEHINEKKYAIERRECPRCGGTIINRGNHFHCKKCDFEFIL